MTRTAPLIALLTGLAAVTVLGSPASSTASARVVVGSVSGVVTSDATGESVSGTTVTVYGYDTDAEGYEDPVAATTTAADGRYVVAVPPGRYVVGFGGNVEPELWEDADIDLFATKIDVADAPYPDVDASVRVYPRVVGTVTDDAGAPASDVGVCLRLGEDGCILGRTAADGSYAVAVPPGRWVVALALGDDRYAREFHPDAPVADRAVKVRTVFEGPDVVVDASLGPAATLRGRLTGPRTPRVSRLQVVAQQRVGGRWREVAHDRVTAAAPRYAIGALRPGRYRLRFEPYTAGPVLEVRFSRELVVAEGSTRVGIDADLSRTRVELAQVPRPGRVLRASTPPWSYGASGPSISWRRDGDVVGTGPSYSVRGRDVGHRISLRLVYELADPRDPRPRTVLTTPAVRVRR